VKKGKKKEPKEINAEFTQPMREKGETPGTLLPGLSVFPRKKKKKEKELPNDFEEKARKKNAVEGIFPEKTSGLKTHGRGTEKYEKWNDEEESLEA